MSETDNPGSGMPGSLYDVFNSKTYTFDRRILLKFLALFVQDPTFLNRNRRFCKATFFGQTDLYLNARQILSHFDMDAAPPLEATLITRLKLFSAHSKQKKLDLPAAIKVAKMIYKEDLVGQKTTLTDWILRVGKIEQSKIYLRRTTELLKEEKYEDMEKAMTELFTYWRVSTFDDIDDGFIEDTIDADTANRRVRVISRIPTGLGPVDDYMGGGLGLGQLYMIVAGTGIGKTTAVMNMLRGAVHAGEPSLLISTEVQRPSLVDKYHAMITGIPMGMAMVEREDELKEKVRAYLAERQRLFRIAWFEPMTKTMEDVNHYIQELKNRYNFFPKLIAIDSPDLLVTKKPYQKPHEAIEEIYTSLFAMTGRENVAMLTVSDVKQASRDKLLIGVTDIGGAYAKPRKVDGVFGIGQNPAWKVKDEDGRQYLMFNIDKMRRDGSAGLVLEIEVSPHTAQYHAISPLTAEEVEAYLNPENTEKSKERPSSYSPNMTY